MALHHGNFHKSTFTWSRYICLGALGILSLSHVNADEFQLATGKIVRGAIVSQTGTEYVLQTEVGTMKINKSDVVRVVNQGTTPVEIEGDIATKNEDYADAQVNYRQALAQVPAGSVAAQRVQSKLNRLSSATQQVAQNQVAVQFNQARSLVQSRNFGAAETILNELALNVAPADPMSSSILQMQAQIHYGKGMAALDAVKLDVAKQELEAAIDADPTFFRAYLALGDSMMGNSDTAGRGIDFLEKGLEVAGDQMSQQEKYTYQYKLAQKYFDQKEYADAAATFAALIPAREKYPVYADALDRAVESYVRMGEENLSSDFRETIINLNTALKLNPGNQKALFLLGRIYLDLGQVENSIVTLEKLVQLKNDYPGAHHYLGRAYFQAHDNEAALKNLSIAIAAEPNNFSALVDRAEVLIATGNISAARVDLTAAKAIDASNWLAYYLEGSLALNEKNYDAARAALMEALDRKRTAIRVYLLMGRVLTEQNEVDGARQWLEQITTRLTKADNLSFGYQVHLADALTQLGEISIKESSPRQAENYLKQALETVPDYVPALLAMADTNILLAGDAFVAAPREQLFEDAESLYLRAVQIDPDNPEVYLKTATFYHRTQVDQEKAEKNYNLYVDKGGKNPQVNMWLVEVGGEPRTELATAIAAGSAETTGVLVTTATTIMTSGPLGTTVVSTSQTLPAQPGAMVLPVDAMMAETSPTVNLTTATMPTAGNTGAAAFPTPSATGTPAPGITPAASGVPAMPAFPPIPGGPAATPAIPPVPATPIAPPA